MPRAGPRTRMRMRRALNLEHSSCFFVAIDAYCVRYSRFSGYDPSDIGRFRCAVWGDDLKMRRTVAQCGSGGLARRFAPRRGQCLLGGHGVQCRDDVHRSILCISRRSVRRAPGTADVRGPVHAHQRPAAIFWACPWRIGTVSRFQRNVTLLHGSKTTIRQSQVIPKRGPSSLFRAALDYCAPYCD